MSDEPFHRRDDAVPNVLDVLQVPTTVLGLPGGRDLAFAEYGDPAGVPVFAFHGTPGSHLQLAPIDEVARDTGVRLIVPDRPGYGHSSFVRRRRLIDWPADVLAIADHLGLDRFAVIGVSGGGPHALACAAARSPRIVAASVVSSPAPGFPKGADMDWPQRWMAWLLRSPALVLTVVTVLVAAMRRYPAAAFRVARAFMPRADRRVVDDVGFSEWFVDSSHRTSSTTARAVAQDVALFAGDWRAGLEQIDLPVSIWHGTDDRLVPPASAVVLHSAIPRATLRSCEGEGHLLFADRVADILLELVARCRAPSSGEDHAIATEASVI